MALSKGFVTTAATTARDTRLIEAGKYVQRANNGGARSGVLGPVPTIVTSTSAMRVAIARADFVISRSPADGAVAFSNDGTVNLDIPGAAPTANSRYVAIWVKHNDTEQGDPDSLPYFGFTLGDADPSPAVPSVPAGAMLLATVLVPSTATATNSSGVVISNVYQMTATRGGTIPYRTPGERTADTTNINGDDALDISTGTRYIRKGGAWSQLSGTSRVGISTLNIASNGSTGIAHGLGVAPDGWYVVPVNQSTDAATYRWEPIAWGTPSASEINVRLLDRANGFNFPGGTVNLRVAWGVFVN
jgi:hypothetical protein